MKISSLYEEFQGESLTLLDEKFLLEPNSPYRGKKFCEELERHLEEMGIKGATYSGLTAEPYHTVLVGIDAWLVDLKEKTFTRLDETQLKIQRKKTPKISLESLDRIFNEARGSIEGKRYGV